MKVVNNIFRYILILIMIISVIGLAVVKILSSTILNEAYVLNMLDKSGYYENVSKILESNFENYIGQSGLDENVIKDIYTKEDIKESTEIIIANIYEGSNKEINSNKIRENLLNNINKSLEDTKITSSMQKAINTFADTICNEYITTMSQTKYESQINDAYKKANKCINLGQTVLCITIVVSLMLLVITNHKKVHRAIKGTGIAITSSGVILTATEIIVNLNVKVEHIKILNDAISGVLQNVIMDIFQKIAQTGIVLFVLGIVVIVIGNIVKYKMKRT